MHFKLHITKEAIKIHEFFILVYIEMSGNYSWKNGSRYRSIKRLNASNRRRIDKENYWAFRSPDLQPVSMLTELFKVTFLSYKILTVYIEMKYHKTKGLF